MADDGCRCWNEGEWGRVHREDCPLHGPAAEKPRGAPSPEPQGWEAARAGSQASTALDAGAHFLQGMKWMEVAALSDPNRDHDIQLALRFAEVHLKAAEVCGMADVRVHPGIDWPGT